jgi:ribonucleoside-diphosphate reductase alpha chain
VSNLDGPQKKATVTIGPAIVASPSAHINSPAHTNGNGNGNGHSHANGNGNGNGAPKADAAAAALATTAVIAKATLTSTKSEQIAEAKLKGYEGEGCRECGNFTLVRNGTCMKCDSCGATSGCS